MPQEFSCRGDVQLQREIPFGGSPEFSCGGDFRSLREISCGGFSVATKISHDGGSPDSARNFM